MCQHCLAALDHESLRAFLWHHWVMVFIIWWTCIAAPVVGGRA